MTTQTEQRTFEALDNGDYLMALKSVEDTKSKRGDDMVKVAFEVVEGENTGQLVFDNYLLTHSNPEVPGYAVNRANRFLKAVGLELEEGDDPYSRFSDYIGQQFVATVEKNFYERADGSVGKGNRIKSFKAL